MLTEAEEWMREAIIDIIAEDDEVVADTIMALYGEIDRMLSNSNPEIRSIGRSMKADIADLFEIEQTPQQMGWVDDRGRP